MIYLHIDRKYTLIGESPDLWVFLSNNQAWIAKVGGHFDLDQLLCEIQEYKELQ